MKESKKPQVLNRYGDDDDDFVNQEEPFMYQEPNYGYAESNHYSVGNSKTIFYDQDEYYDDEEDDDLYNIKEITNG
jgi:hypothetical protein